MIEAIQQGIQSTLGIYGGTLVLCLLSGFIPVIQAEVVVVWASLVAGTVGAAIAIGTIAAAAQIATRIPIYLITRRVTHASASLDAKMARWRKRLAKWEHRPLIITFIAASVGIPPYTAVSLLAGPLEIPLRPFLVVSLVGRIVRYVAVGVVAVVI